jgi:nitrite reductase/ring-hydroxylating ferredoxin subunit/uncharacterized membrane protein
MRLTALVDRIAEAEVLGRVAKPLRDAVHGVVKKGVVKDILSGTWLEHPLHPLLTDIPIGSFTSASVLDLVGGEKGRRSADVLVVLGVLSAVPTAAAGLADWSDADDRSQRIGVVHAAGNAVGIGCYAISLLCRARGSRAKATLLGLTGMTVMTFGGFLGGDLTFARGVGPNAAASEPTLADWTPASQAGAVADGTSACVDVDGARVLVDRTSGVMRVIGNTCTHAGGPLHQGAVEDGCVTCPWHASVFRLDDGKAIHGPATVPAAAYEIRGTGERTEIRRH